MDGPSQIYRVPDLIRDLYPLRTVYAEAAKGPGSSPGQERV